MTMVCQVCTHNKRLIIDRELVAGGNQSAIARNYNISLDSVHRHAKEHISRQLATAFAKKEALENLDLLGEIEDLLARTKNILTEAENKKKYTLALAAIKEARGIYELLCKVAYALHATRQAELELEQAQTEAEHFRPLSSEELTVFSDEELKLAASMGTKILKDDSLIVEGHRRRSAPPPNVEFRTYEEPASEPYEPEPTIEDEPAYEEPEPEVEETEPEPAPTRRRMRRTRFPAEPESELKVKPVEPELLQPYSERPLSALALDRRSRAEARAREKNK